MTDTTTPRTAADGQYLTIDGKPAVRFVRDYAHPIDRVWHTLTDPDESEHWFPSRLEIDPGVGSQVRFAGKPAAVARTGTVLAWEEPTLASFTWGDDVVHFELEAIADGTTRFTLTNILSDRLAAARNAAGWDTCLIGLDRLFDGAPDAPPHLDGDWDSRYARYVAAGIPSGAAIPGR